MTPQAKWRALRDFGSYCVAMDRGKGGFNKTWYSEIICDRLNEVVKTATGDPSGTLDAVAVFMPPRHGKTMLCSELLPTYAFAKRPDLEILALTYSQNKAKSSVKAVTDIMTSPRYRDLSVARIGKGLVEEVDAFGGVNVRTLQAELSATTIRTLREDSRGYVKSAGGVYLSTSLDGQCTGEGANLMIMDDLIKNQQDAASGSIRQKREEEIERTAFSRFYPNFGNVLLITRWHDLDPGYFVVNKWQQAGLRYEVLTIRAQREDDDFPWDPRPVGEYLDMEFRGEEFYARQKVLQGPSAWECLFQQRPTPKGGRPFPPQVWRRYDPSLLGRADLSMIETIALSIDPNQTENGGSYAHIDVWAIIVGLDSYGHTTREAWKLDESRGKWSYPDFRMEVRRVLETWTPLVRHMIVENQAAGPQLIADLGQICKSHRVEIHRYNTGRLSKPERGNLTLHLFAAGRVKLPIAPWKGAGGHAIRTDWVRDHIDEYEEFPGGKNDDRVDAGVQFLRWAAETKGLTD